MDPDAEMLAMAQRTAADERIGTITFMPGRAENIPDTIGPLRMAAFGASFHWTDRIAVARHLDRLVEPDRDSVPEQLLVQSHVRMESGCARYIEDLVGQ